MVKRIAVFSFFCLLLIWPVRPAAAQFAQLAGKVIGEDGKPSVNTLISIDREDMKGHYQVKTEKDGTFRYAGVPLGTYSVSVVEDGKKIFTQDKVRASMSDPVFLTINLQEERARTDAAAAGVSVPSTGKMSDEQMKQVEAEKTAKDAEIQKRQELMSKYQTAVEAMKAAGIAAASKTCSDVYAESTGANTVQGAGVSSREKCVEIANQKYDIAISTFEAAAQVDPTQHVIFAQLGEAYSGKAQQTTDPAQRKELLAKSADAYKKAIDLKADDASYHNNYALALVANGQIDQAQQELMKAAQLDAANAGQYYFNLGAVLVNSGHMQEAADAFKKSTEVTPPFTEGYYQLGVTLIGMASVDSKTGAMVTPPGTQEALKKYLELSPNGPNAAAAKSLVDSLNATVATDVSAKPGKK